jgi:hypothetical protein
MSPDVFDGKMTQYQWTRIVFDNDFAKGYTQNYSWWREHCTKITIGQIQNGVIERGVRGTRKSQKQELLFEAMMTITNAHNDNKE